MASCPHRASCPAEQSSRRASPHATVEAFIDEAWRWVDPSFRILRVEEDAGTWLSVPATIDALSDPAERAGLRFTIQDARDEAISNRRLDELDKSLRENLFRYLSADKTIHYGV